MGIATSQAGTPTEVAVYKLKTTLTDAQIKAFTEESSIDLVPAPGAGKMVLVHNISYLAEVNVPYTNVGNPALGDTSQYCRLTVGYSTGYYLHKWWNYYNGASAFQDFILENISGGNFFINEPILANRVVTPISDLEDKAITVSIKNSLGAITGGDDSNFLEMNVFYSIVDL